MSNDLAIAITFCVLLSMALYGAAGTALIFTSHKDNFWERVIAAYLSSVTPALLAIVGVLVAILHTLWRME